MPEVVVGLIRKSGGRRERYEHIAAYLLAAFPGRILPSGAVEVTANVSEGGPDAEAQVERVAREVDENWRDYYKRGWSPS